MACENFLDVKPKAEVIEREMFKTASGFEDALYGVYSSMTGTDTYGGKYSFDYLDWFAQYYRVDFWDDETKALVSLDHERVQQKYVGMWTKMYESIGYVNNILRNCERYDSTDFVFYNLYKGEALGLRAFMHFDLLRVFAPHIANNPSARGIPYVQIYEGYVTPFSTVDDVYKYIIDDLKEAESLLISDTSLMVYPRLHDLNSGFSSYREIHFNIYAVQATLARVYWMKGDLDNAYIYAKKVIDSQKFPLVDKTEVQNLVAGTISPSETIFGLYSASWFEQTRGSFYTYSSLSTLLPFESYEGLYAASEAEGNDYRLSWFRSPKAGGGGENEDDETDAASRRCMKIVNEERISLENSYKSELLDGINLIRIPEMYLIAAEALLEKDANLAREYFDTFIKSRGLVPYAERLGNPFVRLDDINEERRKEFVNEGQYFYTMKRLNMDITVEALKQTLPASDDIYVLPIPTEEFEYRESETAEV